MQIFFIPARGRKLNQVDEPLTVEDFLYPHEGTETHIRIHNLRRHRFSLSPRGDGNYAKFVKSKSKTDFLYPREGTETPARRCRFQTSRIFFIPARGRKRWIPFSLFRPPFGFSLSPRGDGNLCAILTISTNWIFFIPARGRKHLQ